MTGAGGAVGSRLLEALARDGDTRVHGLVRRGSRRAPPGAELVTGDLLEPDRYTAHLPDGGVVVHLAAATGRAPAAEHFRSNLEGTARLLEACRAAGVERFVFVSTIAAGFADLSHYPYAASKRAAEERVRASGLAHVCLRPTILVGRGSGAWEGLRRLAGVPLLPLPGGGRARVQPLWIGDLVDVLARLVRDEAFDGGTYDVGGPDVVTVAELLGRIRIATGRRGPLVLPVPEPVVEGAALVAERLLGERSPVDRGRLSSLVADGTARPNELMERLAGGFASLDRAVDRALEAERGPAPAAEPGRADPRG